MLEEVAHHEDRQHEAGDEQRDAEDETDGRSLAESQVVEINDRLRKLEERVEEIGSDNLRLSEAHQFATALLAKQHEGNTSRP